MMCAVGHMKVSVVIPSRGRAYRLREAVKQIFKTAPGVEVVVVLDRDDPESIRAMTDLPVELLVGVADPPTTKWNRGAAWATGDAFVTGEDDLWFHEGWLEQSLAALESIGGSGYVGFNAVSEHFCPNGYLVTRDWVIEYAGGCIVCPLYKSQPGDVEMWTRAKRSGKYVWADGKHSPFNAIVENRHPYLGKAQWDETYQRGHAWGEEDRVAFEKRQAANFPDDFEPVLKRRTNATV